MKRFALLILTAVSLHAADPIVRYDHSYGPSMFPSFKAVQAIRETFIPFDQLKAGMVVVYSNPFMRRDGRPTCHRLVQMLRGGNWLVKGDNNPSYDIGFVTPRNYICVAEPIADFVKY